MPPQQEQQLGYRFHLTKWWLAHSLIDPAMYSGTMSALMNSKTKTGQKKRAYRSPLRDERAVQTRTRILDGLVQVMARNGIAELSIPLIARQAGVSIPSVYRYFPTKRDLITTLDEYAHQRGSFTLDEFGSLETPEDLARIVPLTFKRREAIESTLSAAMNSRLGYTMRRQEFTDRAKHFSEALRPATKRLSRKEQQWLTDVVFILSSYACVRAFRDYLGLDSEEAGKRVAWAIRLLARGASSPDETRA
jgi:AcrR family transcriptional regulator